MPTFVLRTDHLELTPLPVAAAAAMPADREAVARALGAALSDEWPDPNLFGVLQRHAAAPEELACFGVWVMLEPGEPGPPIVVGDIGFHGRPDDAGQVEIGYSVVPSRRGRGYATEAARALVDWAWAQPSVLAVVAGCDPDNQPSISTLERTGFERTGVADGEIRWRHDARPVRG